MKRAVWAARDLRDSGEQDVEALRRGLFQLTDAEGVPVSATDLFARMRSGAPAGAACEPFAGAIRRAVSSLELPWPAPLVAVLGLEDAFDALARSVSKE
ncbi:MAG TPA: hypothetical protein VFL36_18230 [Myxococcales bacterium]|nr:hypothetical protein [Myxococcales bacterium]